MDYIRVMTRLRGHPKWLATGAAARSVLMDIWLYCGEQETDGWVPEQAARKEGLTPKLAAELERLGWLHQNGAGWYVHDWSEHQVSAAEIKAERSRVRELAKLRKQRQRERDVTRPSRSKTA